MRHLHKSVGDWVEVHGRGEPRSEPMADPLLPAEFSDLEPFAQTWCLATESERYARRIAGTFPEMQAFYDAGFPRIRTPSPTATSSPSTTSRTTPVTCSSSCTRSSWWPCASRSGTSPGSSTAPTPSSTASPSPSPDRGGIRALLRAAPGPRLRGAGGAGQAAGLRPGLDLRLGPALGGSVCPPSVRRRANHADRPR